jgi:hypothetical protein
MQFYTIIFKFKYRASSSSSYLDKFLMRYVTHFWRKLWIQLMKASNNKLLHCNLIKSFAFSCYISRVKIHSSVAWTKPPPEVAAGTNPYNLWKAKNSKDPASPPTQPSRKSQRTTKDPCFLHSCEISGTISSLILVFFKYPEQAVL